MKKTFLMLFLIALITGVNAQNSISLEDLISVKTEEIFAVNATKASLWNNAITWANGISTDIEKSVDLEDKENGTIILKIASYLPNEDGINEFSKIKTMMNLKIDCKDNKYRLIFSNFTSSVEADRSKDVRYLPTSQLEKMVSELELVTDLSSYQFNSEVIWSFDNIIKAIDVYSERNKKHKSIIDSEDSNSRKGKKEISSRERYINENNKYINYLNFILKGFGLTINEVRKDINEMMQINDDF